MIVRVLAPDLYREALDLVGEAFGTARTMPRIRHGSVRSIEVYAQHSQAAFWHREAIKAVIRL